MRWIRLFNTHGVSVLVNFQKAEMINKNYIFIGYRDTDGWTSTVRIDGQDMDNIQNALNEPSRCELECTGSLDLV